MCLLMRVLSKLSLLLVRSEVNMGVGGMRVGGVPPLNPSKSFWMQKREPRLHPVPHPLCVFGVTSDHLKTECFAVWSLLSARGPDDQSVCHRA